MVNKLKALFIGVASLILIDSSPSHALDTDLYVLTGVDIPTNVLIIAKAGVNARQVAEENCNAWVIGI